MALILFYILVAIYVFFLVLPETNTSRKCVMGSNILIMVLLFADIVRQETIKEFDLAEGITMLIFAGVLFFTYHYYHRK